MRNVNKQKVLFVISTLTTGGANSSLSALYDHLCDTYDISVFALCHDQGAEHSFCSALLPKNVFLDAYHGDYSKSKGKDKLLRLFIKIAKRLSVFLKYNLREHIYKASVDSLEGKYNFDKIVAYQEGEPTKFVDMFANPNKIGWVHCDYTKGYANSDANVYKKFCKIVFVSKYTEYAFLQKYPTYKGLTTAVYNYVDYDRIRSLSSALIEDNRFDSSLFTIITMGRVIPLKRFSSIPKIASYLKKNGRLFKWYILGPAFDPNESLKLKQEIVKWNVEDCVLWLGNKTNPYPYIKDSNLYVALSTTEACPMVFNEARALDTPIVSTDFGSSYEFIDSKSDGIISTFDKIGDAIDLLMADKVLYNEIKSNSDLHQIDNIQITEKIKEILS